jgi:inorganic triphosphatase YgiF
MEMEAEIRESAAPVRSSSWYTYTREDVDEIIRVSLDLEGTFQNAIHEWMEAHKSQLLDGVRLEVAKEVVREEVTQATKKAAREEVERETEEAFANHVKQSLFRAMDEAEQLYLELQNDHEIAVDTAFIRIRRAVPFYADVMYVIPEDVYDAEGMDVLYEIVAEKEDEFREKKTGPGRFEMMFQFVPRVKELDVARIQADGYRFSYKRFGA